MAGRGGKRVGAGRKPHVPPLRNTCIHLTEAQMKLLRMWGRGDMSAGLRWLIDQAATVVQKHQEDGEVK